MRTVAVFLRTWCTVSAFCMAGILPVCGQDEFNPPNPPEPNTLYRVTVEARPVEAGYVSGEGKYEKGVGVYIEHLCGFLHVPFRGMAERRFRLFR